MASAARLILGTLLAILAESCAVAPPSEPITVGALFEATSSAGRAYLVASTHKSSHAPLRLNAEVIRALDDSNVMAFELLQRGPMAAARRGGVMVMLMRPAGTSLVEDVGPVLASRLKAQLEARNPDPRAWQLVLQTRTQMLPVVYTQLLAKDATLEELFTRSPGLDEIFRAEARKRAMALDEVEGELRSFGAHLEVTLLEAIESLETMVAGLEAPGHDARLPEQIRSAENLIYSGDLDAVYSLFRSRECPTPLLSSWCDKVVDGRNPFMAEKIDNLVKRGARPFVVVGGLHLAGPNSILVLLEKQGYRIRRLDLHPGPLPGERETATPAPAPS